MEGAGRIRIRDCGFAAFIGGTCVWPRGHLGSPGADGAALGTGFRAVSSAVRGGDPIRNRLGQAGHDERGHLHLEHPGLLAQRLRRPAGSGAESPSEAGSIGAAVRGESERVRRALTRGRAAAILRHMSKHRTADLERLAIMFGALSNPQRLRIFLRLVASCDSVCCCDATTAGIRQYVGDLGAGLGLAASTVSHHIKELRRAGLLQVERKGQKIECWASEEAVHLLATFFDGTCEDAQAYPSGGKAWTLRRTKATSRAAAAAGRRKKPIGVAAAAATRPRGAGAGSGH